MGVVDFTVLGAVQKVRSLISDLSTAPSAPAMPSTGEDAAACAPQPSRSRGPASPQESPPPLAAGSAGRSAAPRRQLSAPRPLRRRTFRRMDEEEDDEPGVQFFTPGNGFLHDFPDMDSVGTGNKIHRSMTTSPSDSPGCTARQNDAAPTSRENSHFSQDSPGCRTKAVIESDDMQDRASGSFTDQSEGHHADLDADIWCPPPPEDEGDDVESGLFGFDDEDDEVGDTSRLFASSSFSTNRLVGVNEFTNGAHQEGLRNAVLGHFRALVAQLLKGEGISLANSNGSKIWLDVVSLLAWQAANFVKPDTKKGGSMDPSDYVKVKCVASGNPSDSKFVRGVVCSKNVKHKRMVSEHRNAKLLILGGALEYQKVPNKLASINTILEQEKEHLRMIVGKIEYRRPNVLLVEKSVSSYAQELLAKDISLVLNVKRPLLDRISRCTGGQIVSSIDNIASARLGHCDMFKVERVLEFSSAKDTNKRSTKTLMFFEGCPRRLGCTVLLRGACREELKKIKRAVQLAVFAAYHLCLETSFLADEGATLPKVPSISLIVAPEMQSNADDPFSKPAGSSIPDRLKTIEGKHSQTAPVGRISDGISVSPSSLSLNEGGQGVMSERRESEFRNNHMVAHDLFQLCPTTKCNGHLMSSCSFVHDPRTSGVVMRYQEYDSSHPVATNINQDEVLGKKFREPGHLENHWSHTPHETGDLDDQNEFSSEYFPAADNHQSILVSMSSTCVPKSLVCERSQLFRIKFYGSFDKPLGRYLREDLFDQAYCCPSCKEPSESHVRCYTHQHGSLTISVRRLLSQKLPGEHDGRIWMWHRCLKCKFKDGVPPATRRVVMSDAAWGLSFGKFLELSFSNHATANRIASCGHSLQRDCLRFYGYGNMVAFFRYSPVDILSVNLPPSVLDFNCRSPQEWMKREATVTFGQMDSLHMEVSDFLHNIERNIIPNDEPVRTSIQRQVINMKDQLKLERNEYEVLLLPVIRDSGHSMQATVDILELNRLRRGLLLDAYIWDRRLCYIDSLLKVNGHVSNTDISDPDILLDTRLKEWKAELLQGDASLGKSYQETAARSSLSSGSPRKSLLSRENCSKDNVFNLAETDLSIELVDGTVDDAGDLDKVSEGVKGQPITNTAIGMEPVERLPSLASIFSDKIDLAWTGSTEMLYDLAKGFSKTDENRSSNLLDNRIYRKGISPVRIHSFDCTLGLRQRERTGLTPSSLRLSIKPADSFGDLTSLLKDPMPNMRRAYSQRSPRVTEKLNIVTRTPKYVSSASHMLSDGARLLLPQVGYEDEIVIAVYDDEPTSIVSYAMTSQEYVEHVVCKLDAHLSFSRRSNGAEVSNHGLERSLPSQEDLSDFKGTHFRLSFDDETSFSLDKAKFSVTCYFAKQFAALRKKCCPTDIDYIRSLSRCKRWSAQGGKSNVYFAKTMDERFIIKQVTKTELDSFVEFAPQYFKYLTESLTSGSPTCLAKIVGLYQVNVRGLKGGREMKMDLMVMENLFFQRKISRVYDLKGSVRSRYNANTSGNNKVLLDSNLIEALHTKPIFLGSKAKRRLERAVWNDTSFLASVDVMDYSLLVGIDEEKKELVIGIIDYVRQYTWDKQLETWVKASGILGGPKNESPTVISPMQYKKRFRKAMSKYFLTVPDQWSS